MNTLRLLYRTGLVVALLASVVSVTSCGQGNKKDIAEEGVAQFHAQMNAQQYHAIYIGADDKLRQNSTEEDFTALMDAVHRKLGKAGQSNLQNFQIGWFAGQGTVVTLLYNTQFAEGKAGERFTWRVSGDRPLLVGYFINSNALIIK